MISNERRAFKRIRKKLFVRYSCSGGDNKSKNGTAVSDNVSIGGVYFISLHRFLPGDIIDCVIQCLPDPKEMRWKARVVRCDQVPSTMVQTFGVAAEFCEAMGGSEKILKEILNIL